MRFVADCIWSNRPLFPLAVRTITAAASANRDVLHRAAAAEAGFSFMAVGAEVGRVAVFFSLACEIFRGRHGVGLDAPCDDVADRDGEAIPGARAEMAAWLFWVQARGVEDFIRVNVSDAADDGLIEKRRFDGNRAARKVFPEIRACQVLRQRLDAEPVEASNGLGFLRP